MKGLNYMASLIYEISTHAYNKAKYLKSPGKDESGNPAEVVRITKKANGSIRTTPSNSGIGAKIIINAGTLMTASRTYRIMPIFWSKKVIPPIRSTPIWRGSAGFGMLLWIRSKSLSDTRHKTPAAAGPRRRIAARIPGERRPLGCTTLRRA